MRRPPALALAALAVFAALLVLMAAGLWRTSAPLSPTAGTASLPDRPVVRLDAPGMPWSLGALRGEVTVLHVWASWCAVCRSEHPLLLSLAREQGLPLHGLNYKDAPADALAWLGQAGNPYRTVSADPQGDVGFDLGVVAVPETFLIDREGRIRLRHRGPITREFLEDALLPMLRRLYG
jgi:cytochrome c biogenesis protein CcmG/thiol:disulfide interchange protein DsbE